MFHNSKNKVFIILLPESVSQQSLLVVLRWSQSDSKSPLSLSCYVITEWFFYLLIFVNYILFGLVWLRTVRLNARAGAQIENSSRSRAEDVTIINVIIKTLDRKKRLGCEWRHARKRWAGILGVFEKSS